MYDEDIFGDKPIELVIRNYLPFIKSFNDNQHDLSYQELQQQLTASETECFFQNMGDNKHKLIIPLKSDGRQVEFVLAWEEKSFNYKIILKDKYKSVLRDFIRLPESDFSQEKCKIIFIGGSESYRTKEELEKLYDRVEDLDVASEVDIENENKIWYKYIDALKDIIKKRQQPFPVRRYRSVRQAGGHLGKNGRFNFQVDLHVEEDKEYRSIEDKLTELNVKNPKFDTEGNISLELKDIFTALDPLLERDFKEVIIREAEIGCKIKFQPASVLWQVRGYFLNLGWNIKTYASSKSPILYFANAHNSKKPVGLPIEVIKKYSLQRCGFYACFKLKDAKGMITDKEIEQKISNKIYGKLYEEKRLAFRDKILKLREQFYDKGYSGVNKPDICEAYSYRSDIEQMSDNDFWTEVKRKLEFLPFKANFSQSSRVLFFKFKSQEELEQKISAIKEVPIFSISYNPEGFKYKIRTRIVSRKTHLAALRNKIEKLGGEEFYIVVPKKDKETGEWFFPEEKRPEKLSVGTLNRHESNVSTLNFTLNTYDSKDKRALNNLMKLTESNAPINLIYPNLAGEAAKTDWLHQAVDKLTNPTEKTNGKPVNPKMKEFIFDSSKAAPIYDEDKISENSQYWKEVVKTKLSATLNDSQIKAVLSAVHSTDLCLLQGPPGTGKTTVISEIIWQQIMQNSEVPASYKILLTSETNLAVDNALEKLTGINTTIVKPLRFGKSEKFEEEGKKYSLERIRKWADLDETRGKNYANKFDNFSEEKTEEVPNDLSNNAVQRWMINIGNRAQRTADPKYAQVLKNWHQDLGQPDSNVRQIFTEKYIKYANVIGSTCSSCGSRGFRENYGIVFNRGMNNKAATEVLYLIEKYPNTNKIWSLLREELQIDTSTFTKEDFPSIKQILAERLNISFDAVIMDEASKATPPEMLLPLCFGKKSIIIGDHKQLPPMINDREFKEVLIEEAGEKDLADAIGREYLKESQFKRLISNTKVSSTIKATFDVQYRMHSQIGNLIQRFYPELEKGLICGIAAEENSTDLNNKASRHHGLYHKGFIEPDTHVIWVDVPEPESKDGTSRVNEAEAHTIKQVLHYLKNSDGYETFHNHWEKEPDADKKIQEQEIGIISFYGKQIRKLNEVKKYAQKELDMRIRLKTVDKFQGMERNIIIVSTVRSNKITDMATGKSVSNHKGREGRNYSPWGFADSPERLNVALSRARRLLIIVGNKTHFSDFKNQEGKNIYADIINCIPVQNIIDYRKLNKYL